MHGSSSPRQDTPEHDRRSLLQEGLRVVTRIGARRPLITLWFVVLSACIATAFTFLCLGFKTERADLIDPSADFHQRWMRYTKSFGETADIIVVVEGDDPEAIKRAVDELGSRMTQEPTLFTQVLYKISPTALRGKGLQFMSPEQLELGLKHIADYGPILRGRWDLIALDSLIPRLQYQIELRAKEANEPGSPHKNDLKPLLQHTELLSTSMAAFLENPKNFQNPWPMLVQADRLLGDPREEVVYLLNDKKTMGFINVRPAEKTASFNGDSKPIARLRELIAAVQKDHTEVKIGMTGVPVLEADEMRRSQSDMMLSTVVSMIVVAVLLFVGFRGFRYAFIGLAMLIVGMAWAFGFTTLTVGHLNILSVSFAAMLVGLGIDFAVVYVLRYVELRHSGRPLRTALLETTDGIGTGIISAAVTTALAFFCATLTDFRGVAELGVIAGGGILLCAAAAFLVLPPLVALSDKNVELRRLPVLFEGKLLRKLTSDFPLPVLVICVGFVVFVGAQLFKVENGRVASRVKYDYNLLNLQAKGVESVELGKRVYEGSGSMLFAVSIADSAQQARILKQKFEALPSVSRVEDLASRLPAWPSKDTRLLIQAFQAQLVQLPEKPPVPESADPAGVGKSIEELYVVIRGMKDPAAQTAATALNSFLDQFEKLPLKNQTEFLMHYQYALSSALLGQFQGMRAASNTEPITEADLPAELRTRFISGDGKWLLQIYPKQRVWDEEPLRQFVTEVRSVDQEATGIPLQNYEASGQIKESYKTAAAYAFAMICVVLLIDFLKKEHKLLTLVTPLVVIGAVAALLKSRHTEFSQMHLVIAFVIMAVAMAAVLDARNLRDAIFAMLPPVLGTLMMFGFLGLLRIDLNPANLIVLPLVLGTGVDYGIHVVHNFREQQSGYRMSPSTMSSIVLTSTTSIVGFGSLMLAAHRGLFSVGLVYSIGLGSCVLGARVMLPAILTIASRVDATTANSSRDSNSDSQHDRKLDKIRVA